MKWSLLSFIILLPQLTYACGPDIVGYLSISKFILYVFLINLMFYKFQRLFNKRYAGELWLNRKKLFIKRFLYFLAWFLLLVVWVCSNVVLQTMCIGPIGYTVGVGEYVLPMEYFGYLIWGIWTIVIFVSMGLSSAFAERGTRGLNRSKIKLIVFILILIILIGVISYVDLNKQEEYEKVEMSSFELH